MKLAVDFILILGILLNILAIIGLLRLKDKRLPQYILIIFWSFILGIFFYFYASLHELGLLKFMANYVEDGARFLIPPLIFLYIKAIFLDNNKLIPKNLIHFMPFIVYWFSYTLPKSLAPKLPHIVLIDEYIDWALIMDVFGIIYFVLSLKLFYTIKKSMKQNYSNLKEKDFLWLEKFLVSFLIVLIIDLLLTISEISFAYNVTWDGYITVFFIIVAMSYLGYYGLTQSNVFLPDFLIQKHLSKASPIEQSGSYFKEEEEKQVMKKRFDQCMESQKMYLQPDLNLKMIAEQMEISERKLSAFFGEVLQSSFYDSINSFRVEEAKRILESDQVERLSITGIGFTCGFNSKSSFYRTFKKETGLSPSAYRQSVLK